MRDGLDFDLVEIPTQDEALRAPVREFLGLKLRQMPADVRARSWLGFDSEFSRALGERGWLGLTLPPVYGGGGRSQFARFVVIEELLAAGAPVAAHWVAERQSAPLLLRYGTEEQRKMLLPQICSGRLAFCIGMSEPDCGSDLASVRTRATRTASGWRLNGTKVWTTYGHRAHYMIALVRTSGAGEDRQNGLSQMLVDLSTPGIHRSAITDLAGDEHFSEVHFDDVELPANALLGVEGNGWEQVNAELALERSGPERFYSSTVLVDCWLRYLRSYGNPGDPSVQLGKMLIQLSTLRKLSLCIMARLEEGNSPVAEASMVKDLGTTLEQWIPEQIADHIADCDPADVPAELLGALQYLLAVAPSFSLRGGTREIMRGIIARGLGLR